MAQSSAASALWCCSRPRRAPGPARPMGPRYTASLSARRAQWGWLLLLKSIEEWVSSTARVEQQIALVRRDADDDDREALRARDRRLKKRAVELCRVRLYSKVCMMRLDVSIRKKGGKRTREEKVRHELQALRRADRQYRLDVIMEYLKEQKSAAAVSQDAELQIWERAQEDLEMTFVPLSCSSASLERSGAGVEAGEEAAEVPPPPYPAPEIELHMPKSKSGGRKIVNA